MQHGTYMPSYGGSAGHEAPTVVICSGDTASLRALADEFADAAVQCKQVTSAYEVAAEILAAPIVAAVIDFRAFSARHRRLLEIASQAHVEILGVGPSPPGLPVEALSGVRLISWASLPAAISQLTQADKPAAAPAEPITETPKPVCAAAAVTGPAPSPTAPAARQPNVLGATLTPEEIAALLDQSL